MADALAFASEVRAAARNLVWKALSSSLEKVCRLALVIVSAPVLGQTVFGRFQFATTVTTMLALGTDLGLGLWTTRELARLAADSPRDAASRRSLDGSARGRSAPLATRSAARSSLPARGRADAETIVGTTLRIRLRAALPYALVTGLLAALVRPGDARAAVALFGVSALASAFVDHFAAILRGRERFADEARLNTTRALAVIAGGLGALWLGRSLPALTAGVTAGTLASAAVGLSLVRGRAFGPYDAGLARTALRQSLPIWLAGLFSLLYFKGDTILLRWLAGDDELGAYGAAYKVFEGSQLVPAMLMAAAFPALSRARHDPAQRRSWERLSAAVLLALGLLVGLVFHAGRARIVGALYGAGFARAVPSLGVLALGVPLMYLNCGLTHFLIARDLGQRTLVFAVSMLVLNVALNLVAIPRWGGPGAAWATVATEAVLSLCCLAALSVRGAASGGRRPA